MAAKLIDLTDYQRNRPGRRKLKIASGPGSSKVLDLTEKLRVKRYGNPGKSLKGRGFPIDMNVGPDENGMDLLTGGFPVFTLTPYAESTDEGRDPDSD